MKRKYFFYTLIAVLGVLTACEKNNLGPSLFKPTNDNRMPVIISNTTFTNVTLAAAGTTQVTSGSKIIVEFNYVQTDPIDKIQFLQKIGTADSTVIASVNYAPSFSKTKNCDTLLYDYTVPAQPVGTSVVVRARVLNKNGLFRDRSFSFKTK